MVAGPEQTKRLESKLMSIKEHEEELERKKRVEKATLHTVDSLCVSEDDAIHDAIRTKGIGRAKHQFTWRQRACIVLFASKTRR